MGIIVFCTIEISRSALVDNAKQFIGLANGVKHFAPVLKSNAYGHGIQQVYECLQDLKLEWICVNYAEEGAELRALGFRGRILLVGPMFEKTKFEMAVKHQLDVNISNFDGLEIWLANKSPSSAHLKIDTGLSRQGFSLKDLESVAAKINASSKHKEKCLGLYTHFANVEDVLDYSFAFKQLKTLNESVMLMQQKGINFSFVHAASSASTLLLEQSRFHLCRVGMSLYGHWPSDATRLSYYQTNSKILNLTPVLTWKTHISSLRKVQPGDHIGYGCQYKVMQPMHIAILPIGYYEGYSRQAGQAQSYVLIQGKRCMIVGRICMNMMTVDVTHLPSVKIGEEVVLIGKQGNESVTAEQLATWSGTIQYELLSRLNPEIPRIVVD